MNTRLLIILLITIITGCSASADEELSQYINEVKARKPRPIEPIPEFAPMEKFSYPENDSRRSPFKPIVVNNTADKSAPNLNRPKQPLEQFPLDALKFVGVLKQGSKIWALISQPGGEVTQVTVGNYMGKNFGKIIGITETSLKLEESVQSSGKWEKKITTFNLNPND